MCKLLLSYSHPAEVQGVESRKPKANNEQERLYGGQQKLTSWRWELATGKWEGRASCSLLSMASAVATAFATWLLHFTQFGASSAKFLQSVQALTDVIKKKHSKRSEEGVHPFSLLRRQVRQKKRYVAQLLRAKLVCVSASECVYV